MLGPLLFHLHPINVMPEHLVLNSLQQFSIDGLMAVTAFVLSVELFSILFMRYDAMMRDYERRNRR
jgi:hypothetical protein